MRVRTWLVCLVLAALAAALAGCGGDDETNGPPQVTITAPLTGDHLTEAANVVAEVYDDRGVARVRFTIDDEPLAEDTAAPWQAAIPVGAWANGRTVVLGATAWDSDGAAADAAPVTITIDPALQSVPQLLAFAPQTASSLAARWLRFPGATSYTFQVSRGAGFGVVLHEQSLTDTLAVADLDTGGIAFARVGVRVGSEFRGWSRVWRRDGLTTLFTAPAYPGNQAGLQVAALPGPAYVVVSAPRDGLDVGVVAPELLRLDGNGVVTSRTGLAASTAQWLTATALYLASPTGVTSHATADGSVRWQASPAGLTPSAVGADAAGANLLVAGRGSGNDMAILTLSPDDGAEVLRGVVTLDDAATGETVREVAGFAQNYLVAGQLPGGGVWVRGIDRATPQVVWTVRLGTGESFRVRDAVLAGDQLVLVGDADAGGAWAASVTTGGRLRWLRRVAGWSELSAVAVTGDGTLLVCGYALSDQQQIELVYGSLSEAGAWLWQQRRLYGASSRGLAVTPGEAGGVVVVGAAVPAGGTWDVMLMRANDRGELD